MTKIKIDLSSQFRTRCTHMESGVLIETDAPKDNEGQGEAFSPTDLLAASLGSCMLTILGIAARKIGLDAKGSTADVDKIMVADPARRIGKLIIRIRCPLLPEPVIRHKLEQAVLHCPVHASLSPSIKLEIDFAWGLA